MDRDTDHSADAATGCAGCAVLAELFYASVEGRAVGAPNTWHLAETTVEHLRAWLRRWRLTATPTQVADLEALLADVAVAAVGPLTPPRAVGG